jgi:hypothetical protein
VRRAEASCTLTPAHPPRMIEYPRGVSFYSTFAQTTAPNRLKLGVPAPIWA